MSLSRKSGRMSCSNVTCCSMSASLGRPDEVAVMLPMAVLVVPEQGRQVEHEELGQGLGVRFVFAAQAVEPPACGVVIDVCDSRSLDDGEEILEVGSREPVDRDRLELELQREIGERVPSDSE